MSESLVNRSCENQREEGSTKDKFSEKAFQKKKKKIFKILSPEQKAKRETFKRTLILLCERFPQCFNLSSPKPLKKHIEADIFLQLPKDGSISRRSIRIVLAFYVKQNAYYKALLENSHRFNLEGLAIEEIESSHKEYAKIVLEQKESRKYLLKQHHKEILSDHKSGYNQQTKSKL